MLTMEVDQIQLKPLIDQMMRQTEMLFQLVERTARGEAAHAHIFEELKSLREETKDLRVEMRDLRAEMKDLRAEMKDLRVDMMSELRAQREETAALRADTMSELRAQRETSDRRFELLTQQQHRSVIWLVTTILGTGGALFGLLKLFL